MKLRSNIWLDQEAIIREKLRRLLRLKKPEYGKIFQRYSGGNRLLSCHAFKVFVEIDAGTRGRGADLTAYFLTE